MSQYSLSTTSPFLGGLNTELNKLVDSTDFTSDELNCMIRANNTRSRRPGVDYEELYKFNNEYLDLSLPDLAFQCIEWTDINSPDEAETYTGYPYIVCQVGGKIIFFRNEGQPYSGHQEKFVLDLSTYAIDPSSDEYMRKRCRFTAAYGCIFITSEAIKPIYLRSAQEPDDPSLPITNYPSGVLPLNLWNSKKGRWAGVGTFTFYVDGIQVGQTSIQYFYGGATGNCSNGPWMLTSTQLATYWNQIMPAENRRGLVAIPKYPDSTPIRWGIHSPSQGDQTGGNGAWIYDHIRFESSDQSAQGMTVSIVMSGLAQWRSSSHQEEISHSCTLAGGTTYQYRSNLNLTIRDTYVGAQDYLSVSDSPTKMSYAHLYNLLNQGWTPKLIADYYNAQGTHVFPGNNLAQQFLKDEKTSAFKPQNAINMTFGNSPAARGHEVLSYFDQKRVSVSNLIASFNQLVSSIGGGATFADIVDTNWDLDDPTQANEADAYSQVPDVKPRKPYVADLCAYAGRIFYLTGDVLLYSQVIAEDITKADKCYTEADPTGEEISDVIETDGGLISLPDIGEGLKLQVIGESLLIFGTRGNMILSGTANNIFTATAYSAGAVSAVPTQAPDSFVSTEYGVFYWGVTGITALGVGDQGGLQVKDLTTEKILTFYGKLNNDQHKYCKGIYSASKKKIYWFYPSDTSKPRRLDLCLVYDIQRDAFCPQKIVSEHLNEETDELTQTPEIVGGVQLKVPFKSVKEYPIYAYYVTPTTDPQYLYTTATTGTDPSVQQNFYPEATPGTSYVSYGAFTMTFTTASNANFDAVTKIRPMIATSLIDPDAPQYMPYAGIGFFNESPWVFEFPVTTKATHTGVYLHVENVRDVTINNFECSWFRLKCNNGILTAYVLPDADEEYTVDTLPALSSWTEVIKTSDNITAPSQYTNLVVGAYQDYDWFWNTLKEFVSGNTSVSEIPGSLVTYYFSRPCTSSTPIYSNEEMTTQVGTISSIMNDGHQYRIRNCYNWVRDKEGFDKDVDEIQVYRYQIPTPYTVYMPDYNYTTRGSSTIYEGSSDTFEDIDLTRYMEIGGTIAGWTPQTITEISQVNEASTNLYHVTYTNQISGDIEVVADDGYKVLADDPLDTEEFTYESSILLCLDPSSSRVTFGDFRNNYMRDWAEGDIHGDGWVFDSYMISHPINSQDFVRAKTMPYLISYFKRTETGKLITNAYVYPSHCQGSVRWDWRTDGINSKWDSPNELYRPRQRTILSEGYIITKTNIRGIGRAFQIKLQGIEDHNFIVEALGFNLCKDERI